MAVDIAGAEAIRLDIGPALASLDKLGLAADAVAATVKQGQAQMNAGFAEVARAATAYSDKLAAQQAEVRAAAAAIQSAREALRQLTEQQRALTAAQRQKGIGAEEYARLQKLLEQNRAEIQKAKQAIDENRAAVLQERDAVNTVREARRQETNATKLAAAAARDVATATKQEAQASKEAAAEAKKAAEAAADAGKSTGLFQGLLGKVGSALAGFFAVGQLKEVGSEIISVRSEFQKYETVLTNAFDGNREKAQRMLLTVQEFADANGISIAQLEETYTGLINRGIRPTQNQLRQLSDIAATSGKSTDQFVEALLDAQTGEFERLKEFGIKVKNNGDTLTFTFRGVKQEVKNTQEAISDYLFALGDLNGVQGATAQLAQQTAGQITTFKNSLTELFNTIGEGTEGPLNGFINRLTLAVKTLEKVLQTTDQRAKSGAAGDITAYSETLTKRLELVAERARMSGQNIGQAIQSATDDQVKLLGAKLEKAKQELRAYNKTRDALNNDNLDKLENGIDPLGVGRAELAAIGVTKKETLRERLQREIESYKGKIQAAKEAGDTAVTASEKEADAIGRIEALRKKIAADTILRDKTADTKEGNKERVRLNALLKEENDLLDTLLGKEEKVRKARQYSYESQLRALLAERETLTSLAAKAGQQMADDATARAKAVFDEGLRQVEVVRAKLVQRELDLRKAAAKVGGGAVRQLGDKADGIVDGAQAEQLDILRTAAATAYANEIIKIAYEREQRLFDLQADSNLKQNQQIDRHYSELIVKAKDAIERQALEDARIREQIALRQQQQQKQIDQGASIASSTAQVTASLFGPGTGVSKIEALQAEKEALLQIEKEAAEKTVINAQLLAGEEGRVAQAAAAARLATVKRSIADVEREKIAHAPENFIYKLVLGDADDEFTRAALDKVAQQVVTSLGQIVDAEQQAAAARAATATQNINELTGQIAAQVQLNEFGSASNIKGLQDQIAQERTIRKQALDEQRTAAKQKVVIETLSQASSIATGAAEVFAAFAGIPFIGVPLGIAAAGVLIAAFAKSKVDAFQAASQIGSSGGSFYVGGYTGNGDPRATSQEVGARPYEYHRREFVMNHELTDKYRSSLFEPLHAGRLPDWNAPELASILPDLELPNRLRAERQEAQRLQVEHSFTPLQSKFDALHDRLAAIEASNGRMANRPDTIPLGDGCYMERAENGSIKVVRLGG